MKNKDKKDSKKNEVLEKKTKTMENGKEYYENTSINDSKENQNSYENNSLNEE